MKIHLHVVVEILNGDGTKLDVLKPIAPVCNYLNSLFRTAEVTIGSTTLPISQGAHAYVAYLDGLLNYSPVAQESVMCKSLFYRDTRNRFDDVSVTNNKNAGFNNRQEWIMMGGLDMSGPLNLDISKCDRLLVNKLGMNIKLYRSNTPWLIMADEDDSKSFQVKISQAELIFKRQRLRGQDLRSLESHLARQPAKYPFIHSQLFTLSFPTQTQNIGTFKFILVSRSRFVIECSVLEVTICSGWIPRKTTLLMVSQDSVNGMKNKWLTNEVLTYSGFRLI